MERKRWYKSADALMEEIRSTQLPEQMLAVWFLGQAGIAIKYGKTAVVIDLYLEPRPRRAVEPPFEPEKTAGLFDFLLCTHNHLDHLDPVTVRGLAQGNKDHDTKLIVPAPWTGVAQELGMDPGDVIGAKVQQEIRLNEGISVVPVRAAHEEFSLDEHGDYECLEYIIKTPAGLLYHAGDTIEWETMTEELKPYHIDIACLPINGSDWKRKKADIIGNLNAREAADVSGEIGADLLIPMHYDVFAHNGENPAHLADYMWQFYPSRKYHVMAPGERFIYMK